MLGFGLFIERNSYFSNKWNTFDFFVNLLIFFLYLLKEQANFDVPIIESIRFLKLMRIPPIKIVLIKITSTLWLLAETFSIVFWFILFYAIWGLQLYTGLLKNLCLDSQTGLQLNEEVYCGNVDFLCPSGNFCSKILSNPDYGLSNYDNLLSASLQVFKVITGDDWTNSMFTLQKTFTKFVWIYFVSLVIFGNFFMMNLILAVLKVKYGQNENIVADIQENKLKVYDLKELRTKRIILTKNKKERRQLETVIPHIVTESKVLDSDSMKQTQEKLIKKKKNVTFFNFNN